MKPHFAPGTVSRATLALLTLTTTLSCGPGERQPDRPPSTPKVLLIGIDGVRPDVMAEVATPNIDALASVGSFTDHARTGLPSVSGPGWSSMLNGTWPDKHGVTNNDFTGKRYDLYPDFLTRIEQVRPELGTFAVADWKPLVWAEDGMPTISDAVDDKHVLDGYETGWLEGDAQSVDLAVRALANPGVDALFVYLGNPDEVSHETGSIGPEYRESITHADGHVGRLMAAVRNRPTYADEDWLVLMSTDHGRTPDGGHGGDTPEERTIFFLASGPSVVTGPPSDTVFIVDVPVTALAHLGIPADPSWNLDGKVVGLRNPH
ncbi:MAG TPA: alkaline phosphatase family protein [Longimicrobiales bacterium]|nr:alkaline phosphatase family protein [Longimicrobiales bacterium]